MSPPAESVSIYFIFSTSVNSYHIKYYYGFSYVPPPKKRCVGVLTSSTSQNMTSFGDRVSAEIIKLIEVFQGGP